MPQTSVFDRLVSDLSAEERSDLLERVNRSFSVSEEPLYAEPDAAVARKRLGPENLSELGLFRRIVLFFRRFFTGRDIESLLAEDEIKALAKEVERLAPGMVDERRAVLCQSFLEELRRLRDSARFFYDVLARTIDADKSAFFAFLASIELPDTHARLLSSTDPFAYLEANPEAQDQEVRQAMMEAYDEAFSGLPEDRRRRMYQDLRCLIFLKRLSGFLFERLIATFRQGPEADEGPIASYLESSELLVELGDILFSLASPPTIQLMESLFVFAARDEFAKPDFDAEGLITTDLGKAESSLGRIRAFNQKVPLADIIRLVTGNPSHAPRELPAGEDWLAVYRGFWKSRIEASLDELKAERRYRVLAEELSSFIGDVQPAALVHVSREDGRDSPPVRQDLALSFVDAFVRGVFTKELNRPLRIVLMDGEFYRKENRIEFTDAYDTVLRGPDIVADFDARLSPEGELGMAWCQARFDVSPLAIKRRKIQSVMKNVEDEADGIIRSFGGSLGELVRIIRGILKGEAGGRYDSLANLSFLDGEGQQGIPRKPFGRQGPLREGDKPAWRALRRRNGPSGRMTMDRKDLARFGALALVILAIQPALAQAAPAIFDEALLPSGPGFDLVERSDYRRYVDGRSAGFIYRESRACFREAAGAPGAVRAWEGELYLLEETIQGEVNSARKLTRVLALDLVSRDGGPAPSQDGGFPLAPWPPCRPARAD